MRDGGEFEEVRVAIASDGDLNATWCGLGRDFGPEPQEGEMIAAEAWIRTWASSSAKTGAGYGLTLARRVGVAEVMPDAQRGGDDAPTRLAAV